MLSIYSIGKINTSTNIQGLGWRGVGKKCNVPIGELNVDLFTITRCCVLFVRLKLERLRNVINMEET